MGSLRHRVLVGISSSFFTDFEGVLHCLHLIALIILMNSMHKQQYALLHIHSVTVTQVIFSIARKSICHQPLIYCNNNAIAQRMLPHEVKTITYNGVKPEIVILYIYIHIKSRSQNVLEKVLALLISKNCYYFA